jgi:acetamidase/formamidase
VVWLYELDRARRTVTYHAKSADLVLEMPMDPMHGTVGVAPAAFEARSALVPDAHGGNMDTPEMRAGVTAYFGVNVEGALFSLGDGHARQGEGEACGTGVEVAMNTVLIVELIAGVATPWPRIESDTHLMTVGAARPLENAYRVAQVDMIGWLGELCGIDRLDAYQIVAQAAQAPVAQVCNPIYTVTSKIDKSLLPANPAYRNVHAALREQVAAYRAGR